MLPLTISSIIAKPFIQEVQFFIDVRWFRRIEVIDNQNIPLKALSTFHAPSGMIDPLILHSSLPGKVSVATSHNLLQVRKVRILKSGIGSNQLF